MPYKKKTWQEKLEGDRKFPKTLKLKSNFPCWRALKKMGAKIGDSVVLAPALEGTFAADVPGSRPDRMSAKLKNGPVVTIVDKTTITHPTILKTLIKLGKEKSIPFQFKKVPTGGTDAGAIHLTKAGVPSGTVAVPCRYIHGPAAVTHVDDLKNTILLVTEFVKTISK